MTRSLNLKKPLTWVAVSAFLFSRSLAAGASSKPGEKPPHSKPAQIQSAKDSGHSSDEQKPSALGEVKKPASHPGQMPAHGPEKGEQPHHRDAGQKREGARVERKAPFLRPGSYVKSTAAASETATRTGRTLRRQAPARQSLEAPYSVQVTAEVDAELQTPEEILRALAAGNQRWVASQPLRNAGVPRPYSPKAIVLTCSDLSVSPESLFAQRAGELVCVRTAGPVASRDLIASVAHPLTYTKAKLLVVLGHLDCPLLKATVGGEPMPEEIAPLSHLLDAAAHQTRHYNPSLRGQDLLEETARVNVWNVAQNLLRGSATVSKRVRLGAVKIVGGVYEPHTGKVNWMGEFPAQLASLRP
ncbi:MAG: hypothetical protein NZV14_11520 [Bryobacteraceae bacterium]|nr:hypothetical protein [Bryobacteraceae bacterium]MDW8378783.1 carbonic anhydrase [Bryobacterales bacterium]